MAHMIPEDPPGSGHGAMAERAVYEELEKQLPEGFFVYHGLRFVEGETAREGEADFLILHRELGMLLLECKGWGVRRTGAGGWVRTVEGAEEPLRKSPFNQAEDAIRHLVRTLEPKLGHELSWRGPFPFAFGHAVVFPFALAADANLPLDAPREILMDAADLGRLGDRVRAALAFWGRGRPAEAPSLDGKGFERFRRKVLHPPLKVVPGLRAGMAEGSARMVRLTDEQAWVMEALLENRRLRVVGGAGTGKTMLALEAARALAERGERTLLLCFNRALAAHLEREAGAWDAGPGRARAACFHDLCREAAAQLGVPFEEPGDPAARPVFYNQEAPSVLTLGLERGCIPTWDAVVVDEGQDFDASWWPLVESLLQDRGAGRLYVFYDPPQAIFGRRPAVPEEYPVLRLRRNLRNARRIAECLASLAEGELRPDGRCPEGAPVQVHEAGPAGERAARVEAVVRDLLKKEGLRPDQIALLTPHRFEHSSLAGREELAGAPLGRDPRDREGRLLHATISGFKGLESDCVILLDLDPADPRCDRNARYVGASRARHLLHVFCEGDWLAP